MQHNKQQTSGACWCPDPGLEWDPPLHHLLTANTQEYLQAVGTTGSHEELPWWMTFDLLPQRRPSCCSLCLMVGGCLWRGRTEWWQQCEQHGVQMCSSYLWCLTAPTLGWVKRKLALKQHSWTDVKWSLVCSTGLCPGHQGAHIQESWGNARNPLLHGWVPLPLLHNLKRRQRFAWDSERCTQTVVWTCHSYWLSHFSL